MKKLQFANAGMQHNDKKRTSWVFALPIGTIHDGKRNREITEKDAKMYLANFRMANMSFDDIAREAGAAPYRFPVMVNHAYTGKHHGELLDGKLAGKGAKRGIYLNVKWSPAVWDSIQASEYKHVSIGIESEYTNEKGQKFGPLVRELSLTEVPRVQSIGRIQDTLNLKLSNVIIEDLTEMNKEELLALLGAMKQEVLEQLRSELNPADEAPEEGMEEAVEEEKEVKLAEDEDEAPKEETPAPEAPEAPAEEPKEEPVKEDDDEVKASDAPVEEVVEVLEEAPEDTLTLSSVNEKLDALIGLISMNKETVAPAPVLNLSETGKTGDQPVLVHATYEERLQKHLDAGMKLSQAAVKAWNEGE